MLNGTKLWISGADRADYGLIFARTGPDKGRAGVTCFIVETAWPGFQVRRIVHTLRSAKYATEIHLEDLRVPHENILGSVGGGFAIANARLARQRIPYAAECLGVAIKAHEMAVAYAKIRETFGAPLASRQGIQWMLVDNEIDIRTARLLMLDAAAKAERGEPFRTESAMAKLVASRSQWPGGRPLDADPRRPGGGQGPAPRTLVSRDPHPAHRRGAERGAEAHYCPRHPRRWPALSARV